MRKSYKGLLDAMITAENIIESNLGLSWGKLLIIFVNDPIIEPYYEEVVKLISAGRSSLRWEE